MRMLRYAALASVCLAGCPAGSSAQSPAEGYLTGDGGVRLFYHIEGGGSDTVVVLHGGPSRSSSMIADFEPLARDRVLLFYDQRGGGRSELISDTALLNWEYHVRDLEALRQHFGLERLVLIGNSWGSSLAVLYASTHPDRVERMLLFPMRLRRDPPSPAGWTPPLSRVDSAGRARLNELAKQWANASDPRATCQEYWGLAIRDFVHDLSKLDRIRSDFCDEPSEALRETWHAWNATYRSLGDFDWRPRLRQIEAPTLLMKGTASTMAPEWTEEWAQSLPNSRLLWIEEAAYAIWIDQPERFFPAADQFLRGEWPEGSRVGAPGGKHADR